MISNKQLFIKFLKDNNAYGQYMFNFNNRNKISIWYLKKPFSVFFHFTHKKLLITNAFYWLFSPEKHYFWDNINKKWIDCLDKK